MRFKLDEIPANGARMKVVGIGGAGGNAVDGMIAGNLQESSRCGIRCDKYRPPGT